MGPPLVNGGNMAGIVRYPDRIGASMGPPLVNGGNLPLQERRPQLTLRFNGAAVSERRKSLTSSQLITSIDVLQWGRR